MNYLRTAMVGSLLTFAAIPVAYLIRLGYARSLGVEGYGFFYAAISVLTLIALFASLGTTPGLGYLIPKYHGGTKANQIISSVTILRILGTTIVAGILFFIAPWLEYALFKVDGATLAFRILIGFFVAHQAAGLVTGIFLGHRKVWAYAGYDLYRQSIVLLLSFLIALVFELNILTIAIIWTVTHIAVSIGYTIALRMRLLQVRWARPDRSAYKTVLAYSLPTIVVAGASVVMAQIDTIMIASIRGIEEVAAYNTAYPTAQLLLLLATPIITTILPEVSHLYHGSKRDAAQKLITKSVRLVAAASLLGIILLATLSRPILELLFGHEFSAAWPALAILSIGLAANGLASINLQVLGAIGKVGRRATVMNMAVGLNIALNLLLIYTYGYIGAAIATASTYVVLLFLSIRELRRHGFSSVESDLSWKLGIPAAFTLLIAAITARIVEPLVFTILSTTITATATYLVLAIFVTRGVPLSDLRDLWTEARSLLRKSHSTPIDALQ
jgi:O-antigen/teichoic acid export membrane protein